MEITKTEDVQAVFNIFHDGSISSHKAVGKDLVLEVDIEYLAERVNSEFRKFKLALLEANKVELERWFDDPTRIEAPISNTESIFKPELEILSAELEGSVVKVSCSQAEPGHGYCGGFLRLEVKAVTVQDEGGSFYSLVQLQNLCSSYWKEWREKNA